MARFGKDAKCGDCLIDDEYDEEYDDEEELGPYDSPRAYKRHEQRINSRMKKRLAVYGETGDFDESE